MRGVDASPALAGFRAKEWICRHHPRKWVVQPASRLPGMSRNTACHPLALVIGLAVGDDAHGLSRPLRTLVQSMIRAAQQLAFIGFYGDERGAATTGYERFSKRSGYAKAMERVDPARRRVAR